MYPLGKTILSFWVFAYFQVQTVSFWDGFPTKNGIITNNPISQLQLGGSSKKYSKLPPEVSHG